jgi:hypothetical protein
MIMRQEEGMDGEVGVLGSMVTVKVMFAWTWTLGSFSCFFISARLR